MGKATGSLHPAESQGVEVQLPQCPSGGPAADRNAVWLEVVAFGPGLGPGEPPMAGVPSEAHSGVGCAVGNHVGIYSAMGGLREALPAQVSALWAPLLLETQPHKDWLHPPKAQSRGTLTHMEPSRWPQCLVHGWECGSSPAISREWRPDAGRCCCGWGKKERQKHTPKREAAATIAAERLSLGEGPPVTVRVPRSQLGEGRPGGSRSEPEHV